MGISGNTLMDSPPSYQSAAKSSADAQGRSGDIASSFTTGAFNVGGSSLMPILLVGGLIFLAVTFLTKKK